ncbi:MAG: helix-turn-helix domain-containing protein [Desulfuromonadaceae bacterium]|nr:helix-turn-helix domain-containing protein [Desulfuromonadaceae bacterium]
MVKELIGKKLKTMRLKNDMTIEGLAHKSGVSSNMISRIERGLTTPSVEILMKLANAFGMSISYFVEAAEKGSTVVHTKAGKGEPIFFFQDKHQIISLTQGLRDPSYTVFYDTIEKGCNSGEGDMVHVGEEFAMVVEGALDIFIEGQRYSLALGDSICFKGNLPHRWVNTHAGQTKILWIVAPAPDIAQHQP